MNNLQVAFRDKKTYTSIEADHIVMSMKFMLQGERSAIAVCILESIKNKMSPEKIIQECQEMLKDNEGAMAHMLGRNLSERIKNF